jgi:hypothetical protein
MPSTPPKAERPWRIAAALAALHLALALLAFQPAPYIGGDNGVYVALARSLAENGSYRELWDPALRAHAQYPPFFPALLALGVLGGVRGWIGFKLLTVACSAAAVAASYLWLRRASNPGTALAAGVLVAMMPGPLVLAAQVLSDVPFWALVMLALWGAAGADGEGRDRWAVVAAAGVALAYMTRAAGLPLVLAVLAALAFRRRWREAATVVATVGPPAVLWWLWGRRAGAPEYASTLRYVDPYQPAMGTLDAAGLVERVGRNAMNYLGEHLPVILGGRSAFHVAVAVLLAILAVAGWARRMRRPGSAELFFLLYSGLLLVWPATWSGERFLLPLLPLLLLYAAESVRDGAAALRIAPVKAGRVAAVALGLALLPGVAAEARRGTECTSAYLAGDALPCLAPVWRDLFAVASAARGVLPPDAVVLSRKPALFYSLSGYRSRLYPASTDPDDFFRVAREAGAEFVVVDQVPDLAPAFLHPTLLARRDQFCVVPELSHPEAAMARIQPGPPRAAGAPENAFRSCPLNAAAR